MTTTNLTDEEIVKALDYCSKDAICLYEQECPFWEDKNCHTTLSRWALELINSQKAEIERLTKEQGYLISNCGNLQRAFHELQVAREIQINELHEEHAIVAEEIKQQAVKDTAKEILNELKKEIDEGYIPATLKVKELVERYGVEVE